MGKLSVDWECRLLWKSSGDLAAVRSPSLHPPVSSPCGPCGHRVPRPTGEQTHHRAQGAGSRHTWRGTMKGWGGGRWAQGTCGQPGGEPGLKQPFTPEVVKPRNKPCLFCKVVCGPHGSAFMGRGNGGRVPSEDPSAVVGRARRRRFQRVDATSILDPEFLELYLGNGSGGNSGSFVALQDRDPF